MQTSTGFFSQKQALILKREYRVLRAKVLKILDEKFFHPSKDVAQYEARILQASNAFKKIRDQEFLTSPRDFHKSAKILDYNNYSPTLKSLRYPVIEKTCKVTKDLEVLSIENLCKYLSPEEIELVCEDPIYFLGREEYRVNGELNDHIGWNRQLVNVHKKREKEDNWKESMSRLKMASINSPRKEIFDALSTNREFRTTRNTENSPWKAIEQKNSMMKIHIKKIQARNNQMRTLVQIKRDEENQTQRDDKHMFEFNLNDKLIKVSEKKAEVLKMRSDEKMYRRLKKQAQIDQKEKERVERREVNKIAQDINGFLKEKVIEEQKKKDFEGKVARAQKMLDFGTRKRTFITRTLGDQETEYSQFNQPPSTDR